MRPEIGRPGPAVQDADADLGAVPPILAQAQPIADDARLMVVVTTRREESGRCYRLGTIQDAETIRLAARRFGELPFGAVPDEPIPPGG